MEREGARFDGSVSVSPHPPAFAPRVALRGVRVAGRTFDVSADGGRFEAAAAGKSVAAAAGAAVVLRGDAMSVLPAPPPPEF